jgi:hypothetical protein
MNVSNIVKTTQEQAVASWIDHLNQLRIDELIANLTKQDINLEGALSELQKLKDFVADPEHILGNLKSKHGEIAEHVQVNIANARHIIEGLSPEHTFEGVDRTAPEDYLFNGIKVQSKYLNGLVKTLTDNKGVLGHLSKYPDFLDEGGIYHIPKDQYDVMQKLLDMSDEEVNKASRKIRFIIQKLRDFQNETGIDLRGDPIQPAIGNYDEVQLGKVDDTINNEEKSIKDKDKELRDDAHRQSKPTLQEGLNATAVSAAVEGGMSFCLGVAKKLKSGKKLNEFTEQDWIDVGLDTAKGTGKGAIRGAAVYSLTNFTATPAAVASALVTAIFGIAAQAQLLHKGDITPEEFIENSEVVCLDVTVSAIASVMGQVLIPIPVLGAVIGNAVGMFMYGIAKDTLSKQEQALIRNFNDSIQSLNEQLEAHYKVLIELLKQEFAKFQSVLELAFDLNVNIAFAGSITLAQYVGCADSKILKDKAAVDDFFLG